MRATASPSETTTYTLTVTDLGDGSKTASDDVTVTVSVRPLLQLCGVGLCGAGVVPLMPLTLLGLLGWRWARRRR